LEVKKGKKNMIGIREIGRINSSYKQPADPFEMRKQKSTIVIHEEYEEGLYRIEENKYLQVIFNFHLSDGYRLKGPTYHGEVKGVFACCSPRRPGAIGLTTVELLVREGRKLIVKGLDAVDGTPVLDIKPYVPPMDDEGEQERIRLERIVSNPRRALTALIRNRELNKLLVKAGMLHGHFCPGLAMGVMAAVHAMNRMRKAADGMEKLLAIVETNSCFADGIQFVTGCTLGNNSLIYRDLGKAAVTLTGRDGRGIRLSVEPDYRKNMDEEFPEYRRLFDKVVKERNRSEEDTAEFKIRGREVSFKMLAVDFKRIFSEQEVTVAIPEYAPVHESILCDICGESIMSTRIVEKAGKKLCLSCANADYYQLEGSGIVRIF
jgi:formylmethanofuran dehydrogenase subunit E